MILNTQISLMVLTGDTNNVLACDNQLKRFSLKT
jgi:hypothetical protein